MKITEFYKKGQRTFSFEFFPPKTDDGEKKLFETVTELKALNPSFVSVTYGAMGTTRSNTLRIVSKIKEQTGVEGAAHLTCVGHTRQEIEDILGDLSSSGVENIVALRGDPPKGETEFKPVQDGFAYASELVAFIRSHAAFRDRFALAVAGYPEGHVESADKKEDLEHLKHKVDQGADLIITQLFFNNADFYDFRDKLRKAGIKIPIVAGIMPVTQGQQVQKFSTMCGAAIPREMTEAIEKYGDDQKAVQEFGIEHATKQCHDLIENDVDGIHFYTLNKSTATRQIYSNLGMKSTPSE